MPIPVYPPQRWNPHRTRGESRDNGLPPHLLPGAVLVVSDKKFSDTKWEAVVLHMLSRPDVVFLVESDDVPAAESRALRIAKGEFSDHLMFGSLVSTQKECDTFLKGTKSLTSENVFVTISPITENIDLNLGSHPKVKWVIADNERDASFPCHPDWVRNLRDQCLSAGVAFRFEGWGRWKENIIETSRHERVLHVPRVRDRDHIAVHVSGRTAFTTDNPEDPFLQPTYEGWTLLKRSGWRTSGRDLDGRVYRDAPLLGQDRIN